MFSMGEGYIFIDHILFEVFSLMATLLEATRIVDFRMGFAWPLPGEEIGQGDLAIHPFTPQMIQKPGLVMAFGTGHMLMARISP